MNRSSSSDPPGTRTPQASADHWRTSFTSSAVVGKYIDLSTQLDFNQGDRARDAANKRHHLATREPLIRFKELHLIAPGDPNPRHVSGRLESSAPRTVALHAAYVHSVFALPTEGGVSRGKDVHRMAPATAFACRQHGIALQFTLRLPVPRPRPVEPSTVPPR